MSPPLDLSVRIGCELFYSAETDTPALVAFKPRQTTSQFIREERMHFEPGLAVQEVVDEHGNVVYRTVLKAGRNLLRHDAIVKVTSIPEDRFRVDGPVPTRDLPASVLRYLLPSRYADSDNLRDVAWKHFGSVPQGLARVQAICDWTQKNIAYRTGSGDPSLSASQVVARGYGVCRDIAHVAVAFCRAFNIPARYVSGHLADIGVPAGPADFHAYFDVYVADRWQPFDARFNAPRIGRIDIAHGYDATNCAFITIFGSANLERFEVWCYQVDHREVTTAHPIDLALRIDGTSNVRFSR